MCRGPPNCGCSSYPPALRSAFARTTMGKPEQPNRLKRQVLYHPALKASDDKPGAPVFCLTSLPSPAASPCPTSSNSPNDLRTLLDTFRTQPRLSNRYPVLRRANTKKKEKKTLKLAVRSDSRPIFHTMGPNFHATLQMQGGRR